MAKNNTATVSAPANVSAEAATDQKVITDKANEIAAQRKSVLESVTFDEGFTLASRSARWHDVLNAADAFAKHVEQAAKSASDGKPSAIARKAASVAPTDAMRLRFALASYSLAGRTANATQLAELASKLPALATKGSLRDKAITFGGIVLPPIVGEI